MTPINKSTDEQAPHAILPANERGTRMGGLINPDDAARWLALADVALSRAVSASDIDETEALARREQAAIKRRIRRTADQVKGQSKSKQ